MNVFANTVVSLTFKLFDARDTLIEEAREPITYLHGGYSGIFPRVEEALMHKKVGESVSVTLEPVDAFGDYDASMVRMEPVDALPPDLSVGGYVVSEQDGEETVWRVTDIAFPTGTRRRSPTPAGVACRRCRSRRVACGR